MSEAEKPADETTYRDPSRGRDTREAREAREAEHETESLGSILRTVGSALLIAIFIRIVAFELFEIDGPSMESTLLHEDRVVVLKHSYGLWLPGMHHAIVNWGHPNVGDVIILNSPYDDLDLVKRVVGVPGDLIEVTDGIVYRNGEPVPQRDLGPCTLDEQKEPEPGCHVYEERLGDHVYHITRADFGVDTMAPMRVPRDHVLVLGDHRDHSNDSRRIGAIPFNRVKGRAVLVITSGSILRGEVRWNRFFHGIE